MVEQKDIDEINEMHDQIVRDWKKERAIMMALVVLEFVFAVALTYQGVTVAWGGHKIGAFVLFLLAGGDVWFGVRNWKWVLNEDTEMIEHEAKHRLLLEKWRQYCEWKEQNESE